jgi:methionyl-tRNA formyltransferase
VTRLRAAFMGSPAFAVPSLHVVARRCELRVVVCQPDRPAGRGKQLAMPPVKEAALALDVPIVQPTKMKDGTLAAVLREHALDVAIVVAFGRILPPDILATPRLGCINVHASVLPRWRGAAPIQRAILAGDTRTGVTIMAMDAGLDTGAIHRVVTTPIEPDETQGELFVRLADLGAAALDEFLAVFPDVDPPQPQPEHGVTCMDPWPGAVCLRAGEELKLFAARRSTWTCPDDLAAGEALGVDADGLHVRCGDGVIAIGEVQPAGRKRMAARAYAAGRPFTPGERLA